MWSATTETSDNKKSVEVEDCDCGSAAAAVDIQQLNNFANNSKTQMSKFGANLPTTTLAPEIGLVKEGEHDEGEYTKEKELAGSDHYHGIGIETGDSGFISGPQSTTTTNSSVNIFNNEQEVNKEQGAIPKNFNISAKKTTSTTTVDPQQHSKQQRQSQSQSQTQSQEEKKQKLHQQKEEEKIVLDSGCIDEDFAEGDELNDADDEHDEAIIIEKAAHETTSSLSTQQLQQQVERDQSTTAVAPIGAGSDGKISSTSSTADPMILKNNVDGGMSQWFCNLSLQNDETTRPQQQQQQSQVAGIGMNNLDADDGRRTKSTSTNTSAVDGGSNAFSYNQNSNRQQQQQAAGNSATATTATNLWEKCYQQNDDGDTLLHLACISGSADAVAKLIRIAPHPCLFNIQNDDAQTPLHLAALTAQPKILRMLLIAGAEPTIRDRHGNTALHLSCISGEEQCVRALTIPISASEINEAHRQYGHWSNDEKISYLKCASLPSDLETRNYDGERCVHLAAQAGHIEILRILVLYGADVNAREGKSGRTPLHIAIECCNEDLANFLLDECQKLNLETATYAGLTAYQVACVLKKSDMQNILEKRGAETYSPPDSDYDSSDIETDLDDSKIYDRFGDPGYFISYNGGNPMTVV